MTLWRVTNHPSLDGTGGLRASGRWHTRGERIVYCAPNPATALLEVLVHTEIEIDDIPVSMRYLEIEVPHPIASPTIDSETLGAAWSKRLDATRKLGDEWLHAGQTALLSVPSLIVPATWNTLINPLHPDSTQIRIVRIHRHETDPRLPR